jgi:hypothetical protein
MDPSIALGIGLFVEILVLPLVLSVLPGQE